MHFGFVGWKFIVFFSINNINFSQDKFCNVVRQRRTQGIETYYGQPLRLSHWVVVGEETDRSQGTLLVFVIWMLNGSFPLEFGEETKSLICTENLFRTRHYIDVCATARENSLLCHH